MISWRVCTNGQRGSWRKGQEYQAAHMNSSRKQSRKYIHYNIIIPFVNFMCCHDHKHSVAVEIRVFSQVVSLTVKKRKLY